MLDAASADIGELVAQLYVEEAFSPEAKRRCEEMVDHLLSAMGRAIRGAEWMTEATREEALRKLDGFSYKIGYPDEWRDYSGLVIERGSYAENRMRCAAFEFARQLGRLGEPVDKGEWEMPAHVVNAYYHPLLNEIVFPAGILQPPFFDADADDAVNYGAIGAVIGHEITHGFDDQGRHFDAHGKLRDWWTEDGPRRVHAARAGARRAVRRVRGRRRPARQRPAHAGREHRRPRRPDDRARRAARGARRQAVRAPSTASPPSSASSSPRRRCGARTTPTSTGA